MTYVCVIKKKKKKLLKISVREAGVILVMKNKLEIRRLFFSFQVLQTLSGRLFIFPLSVRRSNAHQHARTHARAHTLNKVLLQKEKKKKRRVGRRGHAR